jgi:heavy metal sensor kinase
LNVHSLRFRLTAWYAGLLAGALLLFGVSVYLGLERYLDWNAKRTLVEQSRTIGTELLAQYPVKGPEWLAREINESYGPDINSHFIRVTQEDGDTLYLSGMPKDGSFDPSRIPLPRANVGEDYSRKIEISGKRFLLIEGLVFVRPNGKRIVVESGMPYEQIDSVLHGLLLTLAIYMPFIVSLAVIGGYWLMRRSLKPVDEITSRAEGITSTNLSERLPVIKTGDELERLSRSLNRMIERLEGAFQHINRFSADASHELRTPLTILHLELEGIIQNRELSPEVADQIGSALEETQRLSSIVESLLVISRLDAGDMHIERVVLDLGELASSTAEQMKLLAEEKAIEMHCNVDSAVYVEGDGSRLKQVIVNLVDNAIKYAPEGGQVEIKVFADQEQASLEITDNGVGISAEALPHVFERFYRADKARSRDSGGVGLGLAIVKAICTAHRAEITIASKEGKGSRFTVTMPRAVISEQSANQTAAQWAIPGPGW